MVIEIENVTELDLIALGLAIHEFYKGEETNDPYKGGEGSSLYRFNFLKQLAENLRKEIIAKIDPKLGSLHAENNWNYRRPGTL